MTAMPRLRQRRCPRQRTPLHRLASHAARRFASARRGAIATYVAVATVPLVGFLGLAVDTTRAYLVKAQLSQALDAAGLAGGRVIFSPNLGDDIRMYFDANFPPGFMGATVNGPTWSVSPNNEVVTLSADATLPTTFLRVLGKDSVSVAAATEVTRQTTMLDVVLAIDMSGSMSQSLGGSTRIAAARNAANELVSILFGDDEEKPLLNIGLVPWNSKVRVMLNGVAFDPGATAATAVPTFTNPLTGTAQSVVYYANNSPVPLLSAPPSNWRGCVFQRYINNGITEDDADDKLADYSWGGGDWIAWQPIGPEGEPVSGWSRCTMSQNSSDCTPCLSHGITPLTHSKSTITTAINELLSPTGNTNIPQGLSWAREVLMPGAPFDEAEPNPPMRRQQAIVLLTDGENVGGWGDGYKGVWGTGSAAQDEMDDRLRAIAAAIKAQGVVIYTIQFANAGGAIQALLKEVASGPDSPYYHYAPDAATLSQVFKEVANNLSELRLSK